MRRHHVATAFFLAAFASGQVAASSASDYTGAVRGHLSQLADVVLGVAANCSDQGSILDCKNALARVGARAQKGLDDMGNRSAPPCLADAASAFKAALQSYVEGSREAAAGFNSEDTGKIISGLGKLQQGDASIVTLNAAFDRATCR